MTPSVRFGVLGLALLAAACGEWSGAPVTSVEPAAIPLGPGTTVSVARVAGEAGVPATDSWGATVALAWVEAADGGARSTVLVSVSPDAGASFTAPVVVGSFPRSFQFGRALGKPWVAVGAPVPGSRARAPQVWVRAGTGGPALRLTWHSRDGGRTFVELEQHDREADAAFARDVWAHTDGSEQTPGTIRLGRVDAAGRPAGSYVVPQPAGAQGDPEVVVDEHGALALLWRERGETGEVSLVVRRAWVDWNAGGGEAPGFDAAYTLATLRGDRWDRSLARVPGGVIVSWIDRDADGRWEVLARRLGMDMTCTRESTATK